MNTLINAGTNGSGQSIAVMGQSSIVNSDIEAFETAAGLTVKDPTPVLVPGTGTPHSFQGDEGESDLDLEWSGGMAPGANVVFVYTGSDYQLRRLRLRCSTPSTRKSATSSASVTASARPSCTGATCA